MQIQKKMFFFFGGGGVPGGGGGQVGESGWMEELKFFVKNSKQKMGGGVVLGCRVGGVRVDVIKEL